MKESCAYKSLFLAVLTKITIIAFIPDKNDFHLMRPKHAVTILSNKKNTRFVLLNTPRRSPKTPKDLASFKIWPPDGVDNESLNISVAKPGTPSKGTLQRVVCDCSNKGEARAFGNILLKLLSTRFSLWRVKWCLLVKE
ncbi:hypothetical protein CDAR_286941 [Caerostris darwini]|uniref:Uncharacterized protein n=1 Tax=Caerostris darwini TaxID=1538125 RepID=A0AAV4RBN7_9ARAC|nr:hypothetical protein CDAR_286941 [Caerostris darwini]